MLQYMEVVREIAKRKGKWHNYDRRFRLTKSQLTLTWGGNTSGNICRVVTG